MNPSRLLPQTRRRVPSSMVLAALVLLTVFLGCQQSEPEAEPPRAFENETMNLAFADLPADLELISNTDERIEVRPRVVENSEAAEDSGDSDSSKRLLWVEVDPVSEFGIDLTNRVNLQKELFEALPEGSYSGAREIVVPGAGGKAYYVRGQYLDTDGSRVEEVRVLFVHPTENRLVTFYSRYPQPEREVSAQRIQELFGWVGEMSALRSWDELQGNPDAVEQGNESEGAASDAE